MLCPKTQQLSSTVDKHSRPVCIPMPSRHIYVAEQHEGKLPATGFWREIYTVSAAGNS